jgi:predicted transcriptional regulator
MKRTTITLPDDLDARLRREAEQEGTTVSELTRAALEAHLGGGEARRPVATASDHSGQTDISEHIKNIIAAEASRSD